MLYSKILLTLSSAVTFSSAITAAPRSPSLDCHGTATLVDIGPQNQTLREIPTRTIEPRYMKVTLASAQLKIIDAAPDCDRLSSKYNLISILAPVIRSTSTFMAGLMLSPTMKEGPSSTP